MFGEVVGVVVSGGDEVDEVEPLGGHHARRHAHVQLVGGGVFLGERVGEVGIEQEVAALPLDEKAALSQPPEPEAVVVLRRPSYIGQQRIVGEERLDHGVGVFE